MNMQNVLMEGILYGVLIEKQESAAYAINRKRLISSNMDNINTNVSNLIKHKHIDSIQISNIMIQMLISDIKKLYEFAAEIDKGNADIVWKNYRLAMRNEINALNSSNLLNFRTTNFKKHTSDHIILFQKIIAKDKNSDGYRRITSAGYESHIVGFKKYFDGMRTAMTFFSAQQKKAIPQGEAIIDRIKATANPRMESEVTDQLKNIGVNTAVMVFIYITGVMLLKHKKQNPKSYINVRHNLSLMYSMAVDVKANGWVIAWIFRIYFIVLGLGLLLSINSTRQIILAIINTKTLKNPNTFA